MRDVIGDERLEGEPSPGPDRRRRRAGPSRIAVRSTRTALLLATVTVLVGVALVGGARLGTSPPAGTPTVRSTASTGHPTASRTAGLSPEGALAVRPLGGRTVRAGTGAHGDLRLEVRNGGAPVRVLSLVAELGGVRFSGDAPLHGVTLQQDERLVVVLGFTVDDCGALARTGRLRMRVLRSGVEQEVALAVTSAARADAVRQPALDRVLRACGG